MLSITHRLTLPPCENAPLVQYLTPNFPFCWGTISYNERRRGNWNLVLRAEVASLHALLLKFCPSCNMGMDAPRKHRKGRLAAADGALLPHFFWGPLVPSAALYFSQGSMGGAIWCRVVCWRGVGCRTMASCGFFFITSVGISLGEVPCLEQEIGLVFIV